MGGHGALTTLGLILVLALHGPRSAVDGALSPLIPARNDSVLYGAIPCAPGLCPTYAAMYAPTWQVYNQPSNSALLGGRSSNLTLIPQAYTQGVPSTEDLIAAGSVDWLVTSSAEVACAQINFGIQPMYTFQSNRLFNGSDYSGAVFIARAADNSTVSLSSVRGKRLIAARQGYHLGWAEMNKQGLGLFSDPAQLILVNPDLTGRQEFQALLAGDADVALLPATGIVEQAIALGNLPRGVVKFINLQPAPPGFPFAVCGSLYPGFIAAATSPQGVAAARGLIQVSDVIGFSDAAAVAGNYGIALPVGDMVPLVNLMLDSFTNSSGWCTAFDTDIYNQIVCPAGQYKKSRDVVAGGCAAANLTCPSYANICICSPCAPVPSSFQDVLATPATAAAAAVATAPACSNLQVCLVVTQLAAVNLTLRDNLFSVRASLGLPAISSVNFTLSLLNASAAGSAAPGTTVAAEPVAVLSTTASGGPLLTLTLTPQAAGLYVVQAQIPSGAPVSGSPFYLSVVPPACSGGKLPLADGTCACPAGLALTADGTACLPASSSSAALSRQGVEALAATLSTVTACALLALALFLRVQRQRDGSAAVDASQLVLVRKGKAAPSAAEGGAAADPAEALLREGAEVTYRGTRVALRPIAAASGRGAAAADVEAGGAAQLLDGGAFGALPVRRQDVALPALGELMRLRSPHIVSVYGLATLRQQQVLVEEWAGSVTLAQLRDGGLLPRRVATLSGIARSVVAACRYLHGNRPPLLADLHPSRVIVSANFTAKLSLRCRTGPPAAADSAPDALVWRAPEVLAGFQKPSPASDVYAFGLLLFELFTRRPAFGAELEASGVAEVLTRIVTAAGSDLRPDFRAGGEAAAAAYMQRVEALARRCWERAPDARPGFGEVETLLAAAVGRRGDERGKEELEPALFADAHAGAAGGPTLLDDRDVVLEGLPIGQGGFGVVYRGRWRGTTVAVKELRSSAGFEDSMAGGRAAKAQFEREVSVLSRLRHPNILTIYGFVLTAGGRYRMVMDFGARGSLGKVLEEAEAALPADELPWARRVTIAAGVAAGVEYLHSQDIIHCDLKTANVIMDEALVPRVADFGLATTLEGLARGLDSGSDTRSMLPLGTLRYMAPELLGRGTPTQSSSDGTAPSTATPPSQTEPHARDTYAFGCILYELTHIACGGAPRAAPAPVAPAAAVASGSLTSAQEVSVALSDAWGTSHPSSRWWSRALGAATGAAATLNLVMGAHVPAGMAELIVRCTARNADERPGFTAVRMQLQEMERGGQGAPAGRSALPESALIAAGPAVRASVRG